MMLNNPNTNPNTNTNTNTNINTNFQQSTPVLNTAELQNRTANNFHLNKKKKRFNFKLKTVVSIVVLLLIVLGASVGFYLSQQTQDLRQQASGGVVCSSSTTNTSCEARPGCDWTAARVACGPGDCSKNGCTYNYVNCDIDTCFAYSTCNFIAKVPAQTASCGALGHSACNNQSECSWQDETWNSCTTNDCSSGRATCEWEYTQCTVNDCSKSGCSCTYNTGSCDGVNNGCSSKTSESSCSTAPGSWWCNWTPGSGVKSVSGSYQNGCSGGYHTGTARCNGGSYQTSPAIPASCDGIYRDNTCSGTYTSTTEGSCSGTPTAYCSTQVEDDCGRNGLGCIKDLNGGTCEERYIGPGSCSSGANKCIGTNQTSFCKSDGRWSDPVTCSSGKQCLSSTGHCVSPYCDDRVIDDCGRDGLNCEPNFTGGKCEEIVDKGECIPEETQCNGKFFVDVCKTDGSWNKKQPCASGLFCNAATNKCEKECTSNVCQDEDNLKVCNNGSWSTPKHCSSGCEAVAGGDDVCFEPTDLIIPVGGSCNTSIYNKTCVNGATCIDYRCFKNNLLNGDVCSKDGQCSSNKCVGDKCIDPTTDYCKEICVAKGNTTIECAGLPSCPDDVGDINACTNTSEGGACVVGGKVGKCNGGVCKEVEEIIISSLGEGQECTDNRECRTNNCVRGLCEAQYDATTNPYDTTELAKVEIITYANTSELCEGTPAECAAIAQQVYQEVQDTGGSVCIVNYHIQTPGSSENDAQQYCEDRAKEAAIAYAAVGAYAAAPIVAAAPGAVTTASQYTVAYSTYATSQLTSSLGGWALANTGASTVAGYTASGLLTVQQIAQSPLTANLLRGAGTIAEGVGLYVSAQACQEDPGSYECLAGAAGFQAGLVDFSLVDDVAGGAYRGVSNSIENLSANTFGLSTSGVETYKKYINNYGDLPADIYIKNPNDIYPMQRAILDRASEVDKNGLINDITSYLEDRGAIINIVNCSGSTCKPASLIQKLQGKKGVIEIPSLEFITNNYQLSRVTSSDVLVDFLGHEGGHFLDLTESSINIFSNSNDLWGSELRQQHFSNLYWRELGSRYYNGPREFIDIVKNRSNIIFN